MEPAEHRQRLDRKDVLEDELTRLAGDLHAATFRFLTLLAEFDRIGGWIGVGVKSCAHWLGWRCGVGIVAAREKLRVARAIEALPHVSEALKAGQLSYSKARAITRIATADNEHFLVDVALHGTTGHLERLVRYARKYGSEAATQRAEQQHRDRFVTVRTDDDGAVILHGRLPPELGAIVMKALDAAVDSARQAAMAERKDRDPIGDAASALEAVSFGASRADALVDIAESCLASGYREGNAGERYQVVVHLDARSIGNRDLDDVLAHRPVDQEARTAPAEGEGPSEPAAPYLEDVAAIADETARRLACDASLVLMTERDGETVDVGRRTRVVPPAIRRALTHRDGGCVFPGCTSRRFVDAHHIHHWADGGRTALDNLVLLCRYHHRLIHTEGYTIQLNRGAAAGRGGDRTDGHAIQLNRPAAPGLETGVTAGAGTQVTIRRPDASPMPRHVALRVPLDGPDAVARANRAHGVAVDHRTCVPRWDGEPMDYNIALSILEDIHLGLRARATRSPTATPGAGP